MKYIVAIDWKASFKTGFAYVALEAKTIKDAMIEAPATAARFCKRVACLEWDLEKVYDLHLLTQTKAQAANCEAADTGKYYVPVMHTWREDKPMYPVWRSVYVEHMKPENEL